MATKILLIRHGETAWNRGNIFRGVYDIPLNENGRDQAKQLGIAAAQRHVDAAYTSPLSRAVETGRLMLESHGIEPAVCPELTDFNYGDWTTLEDSQVAEKWPEEHARWKAQPHTLRVPGGNTLQEVFDTAFGAVEQIARKHDGQTVALFAHRVVNKLLVLAMLSLGLERFPFIRQDNCSLNEFDRVSDGYIVICLNDTSHLRQAGTEVLEADF